MPPKPRRPREDRIVPLERVTYSLDEFFEKSGLGSKTVLRSIDEGLLRTVKVGHRQLIFDRQPSVHSVHEPINAPKLPVLEEKRGGVRVRLEAIQLPK